MELCEYRNQRPSYKSHFRILYFQFFCGTVSSRFSIHVILFLGIMFPHGSIKLYGLIEYFDCFCIRLLPQVFPLSRKRNTFIEYYGRDDTSEVTMWWTQTDDLNFKGRPRAPSQRNSLSLSESQRRESCPTGMGNQARFVTLTRSTMTSNLRFTDKT